VRGPSTRRTSRAEFATNIKVRESRFSGSTPEWGLLSIEGKAPRARGKIKIRFTSVSVEYGHAGQLRISPHLRALTLEEALGLARELEVLVERAGWHRAATDLPLEAVPAAIDAYRHTVAGQAIGYRAPLTRWGGLAGDTLILSIRRQASAEEVAIDNRLLGKHRPEVDHYLLSVDVENAAVADRFFRLTFVPSGGPNQRQFGPVRLTRGV